MRATGRLLALNLHSEPASWAIAFATAVLATARIFVAVGAWKALGQVKEIRSDRHVRVFAELGARWAGPEITEALQKEAEYTPEHITALFALAREDPSTNIIRERHRIHAIKEKAILLRIPYYFEDVALICKAGGLETAQINDYFGGIAEEEWKIWEPTVKQMQAIDPLAYVEFERFAKAAKASG